MQIQIGDGTTWTDLAPSGGGMDIVGEVTRVAARGNEDVTEQVTLSATTASTNAETAIAALQSWFELARRRQADISVAPIYVRQKNNNDSGWWRAEIKDGYAASETSTRQSMGGMSRFSAAWTREAKLYSETESTLANAVVAYNTYAGGNSNIVALGQFTAAVYSPLRLRLTNNNAASLATIYAGLYRARSAITAATLGAATTLEAESGTVIAGTGTSTGSGTASGGNYRAFSWSGTTETELIKWSLAAASLAYLGGRSWRVFARVTAAPGNVTRLRAKLKYGTLTVSQSELVPVSGSALLEIGALAVPPYEAGGASYSALDLTIAALGTGTNTLNLDAIHLLPVDGYRVYSAPGGYLANTEILHDDPNSHVVHAIATAAVRTTFAALGAPLLVGASDYASLMLLMVDSTGAAGIGLNVTATAYSAPRRRSAI